MSGSRVRRGLVFAATMGWAAVAAAEPRYSLVDLGPGTEPRFLNRAGEVTGTITASPLSSGRQSAFLFSGGTIRIFGDPAAEMNFAGALGDDGTVLVRAQYPMGPREVGAPKTRMFRYAGGKLNDWTPVGLPSGVGVSRVHGLNREGTALVETNERPARFGLLAQGKFVPLTYPTGHIPTDLRARFHVSQLADGDQVIGYVEGYRWRRTDPNVESEESGFAHGVLFKNGVAIDLGRFIPHAINESGVMIGYEAGEGLEPPARPVMCLRDKAGVLHELGILAGFAHSGPTCLNASGQIAGIAVSRANIGSRSYMDRRALLLVEGKWIELSTLVSLEGRTFTTLDNVVAINDAGQILCRALGKDGIHAVLLTPIQH